MSSEWFRDLLRWCLDRASDLSSLCSCDRVCHAFEFSCCNFRLEPLVSLRFGSLLRLRIGFPILKARDAASSKS